MRVEPSGIILVGVCEIQTAECVAREPSPITAVWAEPGRRQVNVCRPCLEEMVRSGSWEIPGARLHRRFDVAVFNPLGDLVLVVEVKNLPHRAEADLREWAWRIHRNLIVHSGVPASPFFLLVGFPTEFFLWTSRTSADPLERPEFSVRDPDQLAPFLTERIDGAEPRPEIDEEAVAEWLRSLTTRGRHKRRAEWLVESGLLEAVRGGRVVRQAPAGAHFIR